MENTESQVRKSLFYWIGIIIVIITSAFAMVQYIRQPIADAMTDINRDVDGQDSRITTLEANYVNISKSLERIEARLNIKK